MRRGRGRLVRVAGWCLVVGVLATLGGCARSTPGCDRAAANLAAGRLGPAADAYAAAADAGEGDCADAGLKTVGARYVTAYQNVARGRAAEVGHDRDGAATAYRAALGDDADNPAARAGLTRLGQNPGSPAASPVPTAPPATPAAPPPAPPAAPGPSRLVVGLLAATLALLGGVVVLLAGLLRATRRKAAVTPDERLDAVRRRIEEILEADTAQRAERADAQLDELRTLRRTLDALADRTVDRDHRPAWAAEQLAALRSLQQDLERLATRDGDRTAVAPAPPPGPEPSGQLRRDLVDLVAFLDDRLPPRGPTHDRFGRVTAETSP